jgi:hypothetical protein
MQILAAQQDDRRKGDDREAVLRGLRAVDGDPAASLTPKQQGYAMRLETSPLPIRNPWQSSQGWWPALS